MPPHNSLHTVLGGLFGLVRFQSTNQCVCIHLSGRRGLGWRGGDGQTAEAYRGGYTLCVVVYEANVCERR